MMKVFDVLTQLGPVVMLPIIITLFGLLFRLSFGKALRAGVTIGVGFAGINIVIGYFWGAIAPVAEALAKNTGSTLTVIDLGWPSAAALLGVVLCAYYGLGSFGRKRFDACFELDENPERRYLEFLGRHVVRADCVLSYPKCWRRDYGKCNRNGSCDFPG